MRKKLFNLGGYGQFLVIIWVIASGRKIVGSLGMCTSMKFQTLVTLEHERHHHHRLNYPYGQIIDQPILYPVIANFHPAYPAKQKFTKKSS